MFWRYYGQLLIKKQEYIRRTLLLLEFAILRRSAHLTSDELEGLSSHFERKLLAIAGSGITFNNSS